MPFRMIPMNPKFAVLLFCALLLSAVQARAKDKTILPDACGDDSVKFDVKTGEGQPAPGPPPDGKAQIVFIESSQIGYIFRYGMDGSWQGANHKDSYFAVDVAPGDHHLCMSLQMAGPGATDKKKQKYTRLLSFTAEAGKVYYFEAAPQLIEGGVVSTMNTPNSGDGSSEQVMHRATSPVGAFPFDFVQIDRDTGKFSVKSKNKSTWTTNSK